MKQFNRITIIGLGLIGSSIARAAHTAKIANTIVGCDDNEVSIAYARKQGFVDSATNNPAHAVQDADIVIIATPTHALEVVLKNIKKTLKPLAIVMDTGSVKQPALATMSRFLPMNAYCVPAHPIAGTEQQGVMAGKAELFEKKRVIITPEEPLSDELLRTINQFWQALGARVEGMPAAIHDTVYGYVSHLPQLLAFAAGACVSPSPDEVNKNSTLHSFLRLYGSSASLWANIFILNEDVILQGLDRYLDVIAHIANELKNAPAEEKSGDDNAVARLKLFPRIVASCLITTVMEAEKNAGFSFARYAGTGFADFTSPATQPPEADIETISAHYKEVVKLLERYQHILAEWRAIIHSGNENALEKALK